MAIYTVIYMDNSTTTGVKVDRKENAHNLLFRPTDAQHIHTYIYILLIFNIS
jgi:hypothetical protein